MILVKGALLLYLLLLSVWSAYFLIKLGWEIRKWLRRKKWLRERRCKDETYC